MKKVILKLILVLFVCSLAALSCADNSDEVPVMEDYSEVDLQNVAFDTDQTPPDTGAVIR